MNKHKSILIAEDSTEDFELIKIALDENEFDGEIEWFKNGEELIEFLENSEKFHTGKLLNNYIAILDINMPRKNGFEALTFIKSNEHLKLIPCILLTTSEADEDIQKAYSLGANSFITKPFDFNSMIKLFESVNSYWLKNSVLPKIN